MHVNCLLLSDGHAHVIQRLDVCCSHLGLAEGLRWCRARGPVVAHQLPRGTNLQLHAVIAAENESRTPDGIFFLNRLAFAKVDTDPCASFAL
jgi:hypothetical protein